MQTTSHFKLPENNRKIAIVGAGGIVKDAHLPAYQRAGFEVRAIYDLEVSKATQLARDFNIPCTCSSMEELLKIAEEEQCVYDLALPASAILSVLPLLPDGSGVLIQKPMGENLNQARAILNLCRQKELVAGVNFQLRHAPYITLAKEMIDRGKIGALHDVEIRVNVFTPWHLWDFLYDLPRVEILYHSIHYIDLIRHLLGDPGQIYAKTVKHPKMPELASTRSNIIMDYGDFIRANINTNHGHEFGLENQESFLKLEGTEGAIKITIGVSLDYPKGLPDKFEYISLQDNKGWQEVKVSGTWFPDAFIGPMAGLMCKLEDPTYTFVNSVEDAIYTMACVEAAYQSSRVGGSVLKIDF